jgi:hypothetical protein
VPSPNLDPCSLDLSFQFAAVCRTKINSTELDHAEGRVAAMASCSAQMRFAIEDHDLIDASAP